MKVYICPPLRHTGGAPEEIGFAFCLVSLFVRDLVFFRVSESNVKHLFGSLALLLFGLLGACRSASTLLEVVLQLQASFSWY